MSLVSLVIDFTGILFILFLLSKVIGFIYLHFIYKNKINYKGKNVLITGATSGIGEGFAHEFSKRGANVIIAARNEEKAKNLKESLQSTYKNTVEIIIIDFSKDDRDTIIQKINEKLKDKKLSVLINNAGVNNTNNSPYLFHEQPDSDYDNLVKVNIESILSVTRGVVPDKMEKGGTVLNLTSFTSIYVTPLLTVYAATKSFINSLSIGLKYEYPNINVYGLSPMWVQSAMTMTRNPTLFAPSAKTFARETVNKIGCPIGLSVGLSMTYWPHHLLVCVLGLIPESLLMNQMKSQMSVVQKKIKRKMEKQK
jgi:17beta-estradiol 17-dehydrogenase / very-long-chain 3-oxoacyl-CoA reductase